MSSPPAVAIIGINGYIGKMVTPIAFEALKQKRIKELRILSRKFDPEQLKGLVAEGATTQNASYNNVESLTKALTGIDVVISTTIVEIRLTVDMMGLRGDDWKENKNALLEAISRSGVKVYIPSEFGANHYITNYRDNATFINKAHHLKDAQAKVPKVVAIFPSLMVEQAFIKWAGFDNEKEVWSIVGPGDMPVSLTAKEDVGRFTVEAAIMAFHEPEKVPELAQIYSVTKTLQEYAATLDKYATTGNKLKLVSKPLEQAKEDWETQKLTMPIGMVVRK
jgi:NmrA-like family